ncbi:hypothetical protein Tco_0241808 [Tanacetum coccineum]
MILTSWDGKGSRLFKAWQLNIHKKNSLISSKPDRAHICTIITPLSWKQHFRKISIEQLYVIHVRAYMRQSVLDNVLNSRTWELISALHKAKTSYDAIQARELNKDRAYAELERKDKWMVFIEIDSLKQDRAAVVSKFIPNAAMKLIRNDDLEEYDRASDALANASYPFLAEYVANPYASLEQLLSKKPPMLQSTFFGSRSKPLSSKVK